MPHYSYLLFDADNTLFDFDAANRNAFHAVCRQCDIPDTDETFALYERCNNRHVGCLRPRRVYQGFSGGRNAFAVSWRPWRWIVTPPSATAFHLKALGESTLLLPMPRRSGRTLSRTHHLYIVTNAVGLCPGAVVCHRSAVAPYITDAFISEEPEPASPAEPTSTMFSPHPRYHTEDALLIGDSPSSDIRASTNAGIPCC